MGCPLPTSTVSISERGTVPSTSQLRPVTSECASRNRSPGNSPPTRPSASSNSMRTSTQLWGPFRLWSSAANAFHWITQPPPATVRHVARSATRPPTCRPPVPKTLRSALIVVDPTGPPIAAAQPLRPHLVASSSGVPLQRPRCLATCCLRSFRFPGHCVLLKHFVRPGRCGLLHLRPRNLPPRRPVFWEPGPPPRALRHSSATPSPSLT